MRIEEAIGVCSVREDTEMLARAAAERAPRRALDLGTGTGYVAIHLALGGARVDAIDVSPRALALARRNVARHGVDVDVFRSDLYEATRGTYDVIASNPPQRPEETERSRLVTSTLRRMRRVASALTWLTQPVLQRRRMPFLETIARGALERLTPGGALVLAISPYEIERLESGIADLRLIERRPVPTIAGLEVAIFARAR